jgi:transcriptional regulator with XRE-family HTH domain
VRSGELIKDLRRRHRLTQEQLAARSGIAQSVISQYESGRRDPTVERLEALLNSCGETLRSVPIGADAGTEMRVPAAFLEVLAFGETFQRKGPDPLPDMTPVWRRARQRCRA